MPNDLSPEEIARSHRWHAVECNNLAWRLSQLPKRTSIQDAEMLHAAHASAYHWGKVGTELHAARAKMLLAHVHASLGNSRTATDYARECHDYLMAHDPPDWEQAFVHAVLAHAAYAAGDEGLHRKYYTKAEEIGGAIADPEDKGIFLETFSTIPKPGRLSSTIDRQSGRGS
ncbi:MAG TPA: hypothetical protein VFI11_12415 [Anaerolineales bacterium]|nr:hypothetical protein [Anaerolineales bacterium]